MGVCMGEIVYSEKALESMAHRFSRLKPIELGDACCNCGQDCDGDGFVVGPFHARRVNGHPLCARCYSAQIEEYIGRRSGCRCYEQKAKRA